MGAYDNYTIDNVIKIFSGFACWLVSIIVAVMIIFIIIAGFRFMMTGGNPEKYDKAKKNLGYLLIGIVVIFGVNVILQSVARNLGSTTTLIPFTCPR